jgi:hypothetical protein
LDKLQSAESQILDLRVEVELLEERRQDSSSSLKEVSIAESNPRNVSTFSVPPELRQFIVSAITCDEQQRGDGTLLLANLIGCTIEACYHLISLHNVLLLGEAANWAVLQA